MQIGVSGHVGRHIYNIHRRYPFKIKFEERFPIRCLFMAPMLDETLSLSVEVLHTLLSDSMGGRGLERLAH